MDERWIQIGNLAVSPHLFRQWCKGERPLPGQDPRLVFAELTPEEWPSALERYLSLPPPKEGVDYVTLSPEV